MSLPMAETMNVEELAVTEMSDAVFYAVLSCPHTIDHEQITIRFDPKEKGHNALFQLSARVKSALQSQFDAGRRALSEGGE